MVGLVALLVGCGTPPGAGGGDPQRASVPSETPAPPEGVVLAQVGAHGAVTESDFAELAARTPPDGPELTLAQRHEIFDELVEQELLFQEAFAQGLYRDAKVKRALVQQLLRNEVLEKLKDEPLLDEDLRAYFESHKDAFQIPAKAQVRRIYLRIDANRTEEQALALAKDLERQIRADPSKFRDLAQQHSEDAYKRRGGDMGYVDRVADSPHPSELVERAFSIPIDQVSAPFVAGNGVNLIVVAARRDGVERAYEQVKGTVIRTVRSARFDEASAAYIAALGARTEIQRPTDDQLAAVSVDARLGNPRDPEGQLPGTRRGTQPLEELEREPRPDPDEPVGEP
jgi:peptidyl-prolyl cis-trans isomerase C